MTDRLSRLIASGWATARDLADVDFETVLRHKTDSVQIRDVAVEPTPLEGRRIRYVWSTATVDRMGDIVQQDWNLGPFTRNPVALWNHDHDVVLGKAHDFGVEFRGDQRLVGTIEFAPEGTDPLIDSRYKLAAAGFLPATSVGFLPGDVDPVRDAEKRAELGLGDYGVVFRENQLLEISVVSVPANPDAVRESVERGILSADEAEMVARDSRPTERDTFKRLERLALASTVRTVEHPDGDLVARVERLERQLADINRPQGDAHGVEPQLDQPGSGSGWDIAKVLAEFSQGVSRGLGSDSSQTTEVPHG